MPEQIISASGTQYGMAVNPDGSINTVVLGSVFIGSVTAHVDSIYVQSGDNINITSLPGDIGSVVVSSSTKLGVSGIVEVNEVVPNAVIMNNPTYEFIWMTSGILTGVLGSSIGSIVQWIGAGSYTQLLTWDEDLIIKVGSWT